MKKRIISLAMLAVCILSLSAHAAVQNIFGEPYLEIVGTTAICTAAVESTVDDDEIKLILTLWCGESIVTRWIATGNGEVVIDEECDIVEGNTYRLVMMPVINGVAEETVTAYS